MSGVTRASARQLGYAQNTSAQTGIGTSATDITGLVVPSFVASSRPVWVVARFGIKLNTAAGLVLAYITDSSNNQVNEWYRNLAIGEFGVVHLERRLAILTPGTSYSFKARIQAPAGATVDVQGSVDAIPTTLGGPGWIRAFEE